MYCRLGCVNVTYLDLVICIACLAGRPGYVNFTYLDLFLCTACLASRLGCVNFLHPKNNRQCLMTQGQWLYR